MERGNVFSSIRGHVEALPICLTLGSSTSKVEVVLERANTIERVIKLKRLVCPCTSTDDRQSLSKQVVGWFC